MWAGVGVPQRTLTSRLSAQLAQNTDVHVLPVPPIVHFDPLVAFRRLLFPCGTLFNLTGGLSSGKTQNRAYHNCNNNINSIDFSLKPMLQMRITQHYPTTNSPPPPPPPMPKLQNKPH